MSITITWNGHSCFTVEADGYSIVLDPYGPDSVPGLTLPPLTADMVLTSHDHRDHGAVEAVTLSGRETGSPAGKNPFTVTILDTFHDDEKGARRGPNKIHILEADGVKIAHLGDLGCELTEDQIAALSGLDAVLIPVGGFYTIDATQAKALVTRIQPAVTVPMHYRSEQFGYDVIGTLEEYTKLCDDVATYETNRLTIDKGMGPQTAVLRLI